MRGLAYLVGAARHAAGAVVEAALIVAIAGTVIFGWGAVVGDPVGAGQVDAAPKTKVTMLAAPAPVAVNGILHLTGAGLDPSQPSWVRTQTSTAIGWWNLGVNADGTYAIDLSFPTAGNANISIYQLAHNRYVLMSSCTVLVQ